jgi:hypothetical protein
MHGGRRSLLSLLLLLPAGIVWILTMVWPVVRLFAASLSEGDLIRGGAAYPSAFPPGYGASVARALSLWLVPLVVFVVVGLLVGWAGSRSGRQARITARCLLVLPLACFAPMVAVGAWESSGVTESHLLLLAGTLGAVCAVGSLAYLAAFRAARPYQTAGVVTAVAVFAFFAIGIQDVSLPYLLRTHAFIQVPASALVRELGIGNFGVSAAQTLGMVAIAGVLGLGAVALLIGTGTDLVAETATDSPPTDGNAKRALLGIVVVVLAASAYALWPWVGSLFAGSLPGFSRDSVFADTWVAPLPSVVACLVTALPAAFCIGFLRPLGRRSDLLLLPFAPWLFVGVVPVAVMRLLTDARGPLKGMQGIEPMTQPIWLSVPVLVVLTLMFRGQSGTYQAAVAQGVPPSRALAETCVRPMWPAVALAGLVIWVVEACDFTWPATLLDFSSDLGTAPKVYADALLFTRVGSPSTRIVTPFVLIVVVLTIVVAAQSYLDRWIVRTQPLLSTAELRVPAQRVPQDPVPVAASRPAAYRILGICAAAGLALSLIAVTLTFVTSGTGSQSPVLPNVASSPVVEGR